MRAPFFPDCPSDLGIRKKLSISWSCEAGGVSFAVFGPPEVSAALGAFDSWDWIPARAHPQRSISHQSRQDPAARDTIDDRPPESAVGSANAFCLPPASGNPSAQQDFGELSRAAVFDLVERNAGPKVECNARGFIRPEFDDREEAGSLAYVNFPFLRCPLLCAITPKSSGIYNYGCYCARVRYWHKYFNF